MTGGVNAARENKASAGFYMILRVKYHSKAPFFVFYSITRNIKLLNCIFGQKGGLFGHSVI